MTYVNDSKATNVEATLTALTPIPESTHLILGGRDKAPTTAPIARACARGCRAVYLIGEATPLIAARVRGGAGSGCRRRPRAETCGDLESAVRAAAARHMPGEVVLLAPACASFDQYEDFEERGEHFRRIVPPAGRAHDRAGRSRRCGRDRGHRGAVVERTTVERASIRPSEPLRPLVRRRPPTRPAG